MFMFRMMTTATKTEATMAMAKEAYLYAKAHKCHTEKYFHHVRHHKLPL
jgi:hypothetical protein